MGGGGIKQSQATEQKISQQQSDTAAKLADQGQQSLDRATAEQAPLVNFLKGVIGGNSTNTHQALSPVIGNITRNAQANKERIYDTTGPGVARDVLLGENTRNTGTSIAGATNDVFLKAFPELASLASGDRSAGLGLTGAGITSESNAASTTGSVLNSQVQQKAATLGFFGQLAGAAGMAAGGGAFK